VFVFLNGYAAQLDNVSWVIRWAAYLNPAKYGYEAMVWAYYPDIEGELSVAEF